MLQEITAAIDHLSTLLHPSVEVNGFKQEVERFLESRYSRLWFPENPNRASASRVILWHAHGGGEGLDHDLLQACRHHCRQDSSPSDVDYFSSPFTLWIDPGCVSIRLGFGPGLSFTSAPSLLSNIKIIFSKPQQQTDPRFSAPPMLTLIPSTPALLNNKGWSDAQPLSSRAMYISYQHSRSRSPSGSSSICESRSTSQTGSYTSSADDCPSLTAQEDSDSEGSIEDIIDNRCFKNFDIIDDVDEQDNEGDETITHDIRQHLSKVALDASAAAAAASPASSAGIVNYDRGNVGVLGGGIRLGGGAKLSSSQSGISPPALPSPTMLHGYGFPSMQQYSSIMMEGYAIPMAKRIRSRGRRSRGRGAGRAARRQAAVALEANEQDVDQEQANSYQSEEDERIMAVVRQRASQVTSDVIKRQSINYSLQSSYHHQQQPAYHQQYIHQSQQYAMPMHHNRPTFHHQLPIHHQFHS